MSGRGFLWQAGRVRGVIWTFRCDYGHEWSRTEIVSEQEPEAGSCPVSGHTAVTASRQPWADRPRFALLPVERVTDLVRGTTTDEGRFRLDVMTSSPERVYSTPEPIRLDRAMAVIKELSQDDSAEVARKAKRLGLTEPEDT